MLSYVFISHSSEDDSYVQLLPREFKRHGFRVWIDEYLKPGDRQLQVIPKKIKRCDAVVVIMTPEAGKSDWVEKEILLAKQYKKPLVGLLLRGEVLPYFINQYYIRLTPERKYLPPLKLYKYLSQYVSRVSSYEDARKKKEEKDAAELARLEVLSLKEDNRTEFPTDEVYLEIAEWSEFAVPGVNDYNGIARLAIAYEAEGSIASHKDALKHLKRAMKLEPRVKNKIWMTEHHGWTEKQHQLLEKILTDPAFDRYPFTSGIT